MKIGPIFAPSLVPQNPLKPLRTKLGTLRQTTHLQTTTTHALQGDVFAFSIDVVVMQQDADTNRAVIQQLLELGRNAEWNRCGIFLQLREDIIDREDGWYVLDAVDMPEMSRDLGWTVGRLDVTRRALQNQHIAVFVDQKAVPNDANLAGLALAAYPRGIGSTTYPASTWSFLAADGSQVAVVEAPPATMRTSLLSPTATMSLGRCRVMDEA